MFPTRTRGPPKPRSLCTSKLLSLAYPIRQLGRRSPPKNCTAIAGTGPPAIAGFAANSIGGRESTHVLVTSTRGKNRQPDRVRSGIFEVHASEIELAFANAVHQIDTGERDGCAAEPLDPSVTFAPDLIWRLYCSIGFFRDFKDRNFVRQGHDPPAIISRTARRDAA